MKCSGACFFREATGLPSCFFHAARKFNCLLCGHIERRSYSWLLKTYANVWYHVCMYTPAQFAKRVGVSVKTLQKWDRINVLPTKRTITNRRYYTEDDLAAALRLPRVQKQRRTVAYCRVSRQAQKPALANQQAVLRDFCRERGIQVDEWIMEIGGGLNFKRKAFLALVDAILEGQVERVVLAHQDRLARFGYQLLVHLCQTHQCELLVMNTEELSPEQELVQDLITITYCFSSRLDGLRTYRKALRKAIADDQSAQDQASSHA